MTNPSPSVATIAAIVAATTKDPRALALAAASDPMPSALERSPYARIQWRHGLDVDPDLQKAVVDDNTIAAREYPALTSEMHASLLDPDGTKPLARPSPIGRTVMETLTSHKDWPTLCDASQAHPTIAREATVSLASAVRDALARAGATSNTDAREALAKLDAAREALKRAREAQRNAKTPDEQREALRKATEAATAEERAASELAKAEGIAARCATDPSIASAIASAKEHAKEQAEAVHLYDAMLGDGTGVGGPNRPVPDDVVKALGPHAARMMKLVSAFRAAIAQGRATRHVRGREGMIGVTTGGLNHVTDLTAMSLASLSGALGAPMAALTRLSIVEGSVQVIEKGGGIARDGHVVLVVDKSGSMSANNYAPDTWASGLAMAMLIEARKDNRVAGLVVYDGDVRFEGLITDAASLARAVVAISEPASGSNNERAALHAASRLLAAMPLGGDPADVIFLTDGRWQASNLTGTMFAPNASTQGGGKHPRLKGCFIGGAAPVGAGFAETWELRSVSDADGNISTDAMSLGVTIAKGTV